MNFIKSSLLVLGLLVVFTPAASAITYCHDWTIYRLEGGADKNNKTLGDLRGILASRSYNRYNGSRDQLPPGSVVILGPGNGHSGYVEANGRITHFIQKSGGLKYQGVAYKPEAVPPGQHKQGGRFLGHTLDDMLGEWSGNQPVIEIWSPPEPIVGTWCDDMKTRGTLGICVTITKTGGKFSAGLTSSSDGKLTIKNISSTKLEATRELPPEHLEYSITVTGPNTASCNYRTTSNGQSADFPYTAERRTH